MFPMVWLLPPLLKLLHAELGMYARHMWVWVSYRCLHLCLWRDLVIHLCRVDLCSQVHARGVWLLPLIEGLELTPELLHICPGGVGRMCRHMPIPTFQYGVRSVVVHPSCWRLQAFPDISCCLFYSPPGIRHQWPADGSLDTPLHVRNH